MKKLSQRNRKHLASRARYQKRKVRRNRKFRLGRIKISSYFTQQRYRRQNLKKEARKPGSTLITKTAPDNFSVFIDVNAVVAYISELKAFARPNYSGYSIFIDMSKVTKIDIGSISLLLSIVEELAQYGLKVKGNLPKEKRAHGIFVESGYLSHMNNLAGHKFEFLRPTNSILKRGTNTTLNREVGETVQNAIKMLTGKKAHYNPVYSIIQELSGNSVEHAYYNISSREHWVLAVYKESGTDKVIFTFADNGQGILKTLRRKLTQQFFEKIGYTSDGEIINGAFEKKYDSRHKRHVNRNKGLPLIRKISDNKGVSNLFVITNKVLLFLDNGKTISLDKNFSGTFYCWELDLQTINRWNRQEI